MNESSNKGKEKVSNFMRFTVECQSRVPGEVKSTVIFRNNWKGLLIKIKIKVSKPLVLLRKMILILKRLN